MSDVLHEWVADGAPIGVQHLKLHVEQQRYAARMLALAVVLIVVTAINLALTTWSIWLRFGAVSQ